MSIIVENIARNIYSVIIDRQSTRNAINLELLKKLRGALDRLESLNPDDCRVVIISGRGGNFCSGYDLNEVIDKSTGMPNIRQIEQLHWPYGTRLMTNKLTIAAMEGHAAGFGFELSLKCDFRVADQTARMGFLNRRFGVPIMNGGTVILPKLIGFARSMEMIATGKAQLAPEAIKYGTITHICDVGCANGRALNLARSLAKFDNECLMRDFNQLTGQNNEMELNLMRRERVNALEYLRKCSPLDVAVKFLKGELCRHGSMDMGNLLDPTPEVTL